MQTTIVDSPLRMLYVDPAVPEHAVWQDFPFLDHARPLDMLTRASVGMNEPIRNGNYHLTGRQTPDGRWIYEYQAS